MYQVYNWQYCQVIKAGNDGVWMRKSKEWLKVTEKYNFRMWFSDKERKETNSYAERTIGIIEVTGKSCLWQRG